MKSYAIPLGTARLRPVSGNAEIFQHWIKCRAQIFTTVFLLCLFSIPVYAESAVGQFSSTNNPNGDWSYGYETTLGGTFTLLTAGSCGSLLGWQLDGAEPWVLGNPSGITQDCGSGRDPDFLLDMHPGALGQYSVVRWTAPASGSYSIVGVFVGIDPHPTTTDVHVLLNAVAIFSHKVTTFHQPARFNLSEALNAGDTIDFAVGYGTDHNYEFDSTGFAATILVAEGVAK